MTQPSRHFVRETADQVHNLLAAYRQACAEARTRIASDDQLYGNEAKTAATREALNGLRDLYSARLDAVASKARSQLAALQSRAAQMLPKPATGVEALLGRQAWWSRIRTMLDSGIRPQEIVATATDPEMLHALADELPTATAAGILQFTGGAEGGKRAITARLAQLAGPDVVDAMEAADDAEAQLDALEPIMQNAANEIGVKDFRLVDRETFADELSKLGVRLRY